MAATYERITREDLEAWLHEKHPGAFASEKHEGVYLIPLSRNVAIYLSTSIGRDDRAVGKGRGACHLKLVSLKTHRVLNRKGLGQTRYNRTSGWRVNWWQGVERMISAYQEHREFYDTLAIETQESYAARKVAQIEALGQSSPFLESLKKQVQEGKFLTTRQEAALSKFQPGALPQKRKVDQSHETLETLRSLYKKARDADDSWTRDFVGSVGKRVRAGEFLSGKQVRILNQKLTQYDFDLQV